MNAKIASLISSIDLLPGAWCLMDTGSRYIHYNLAYLKMVGAERLPRYELVGKTVADLPCEASTCAKLFWMSDEEVKHSKKAVTVIHIIKMANDNWWVVQTTKTPVLNENNEVEAILSNFVDYANNQTLDLALQLHKNLDSSVAIENSNLIKFTRSNRNLALGIKESEVLFYLVKGLPYKEIAKLQNISYSTVVDHVERLKNKFNAATLDELIKNALLNGYPKNVPMNLFNRQFSIIIAD